MPSKEKRAYQDRRKILLCLLIMGCPFLGPSKSGPAASVPPLRLGVVGYEGHGVLFTKELNAGLGERIGLVVTQVWHRGPVPREDRDEYGFAVVTSPEQMIGKVDGVFIAKRCPSAIPIWPLRLSKRASGRFSIVLWPLPPKRRPA